MMEHTTACEYPEGCSCGASECNRRENEILDLQRRLKVIRCIFCKKSFGDVTLLKIHSATCPEHPAVIALQKLQLETRTIYVCK